LIAGLANFAEPTLLLLGDMPGLLTLKDFFEKQDSVGIGRLLNLVEIQLEIHFAPEDSGLEKSGTQFAWYISPMDAKKFARLIEEVASSEKPAHAYLDTSGHTGFEIIVSKGEYEASVLGDGGLA
jgi:hypothetical protein